MVLGAVWYGPLFGKTWMKGVGLTTSDIENRPMVPSYLVAILNSFLMAFVLANVVSWTGVMGVIGGMFVGFFMWLGFTGFSFGVNHAFEGRSTQLWAINSGLYLVGLVVMGAIMAVW